jgi:hypothetical protein
MTRRKGRANGRTGLWQDTPDGPIPAQHLPPELATSPLLRECPACHAAPRQRCTRPARGGRKTLKKFHPARTEPEA